MMLRSIRVNAVSSGFARSADSIACRSVKSFTFVASTRRAGTKSLHRIMEAAFGCVAVHKPSPRMSGPILKLYNDGNEELMWREFQLKKLRRIYQRAAFRRWYLETNHLFIKCFADAAAQAFGSRLKVVHITRDPHPITCSLLSRKSIPGSESGSNYLIDPRASRNLIPMSDELYHGEAFTHDHLQVPLVLVRG